MQNTEKRGKRDFFNGTGFYIALFLFATAIAVAGYWSVLPRTPPESAETAFSGPDVADDPGEAPEIQEEFDLPVSSAAEISVPEPAISAPTKDVAAAELIVSPLSGETVAAFSVDELVYSETLSDWRTHNGVDIAAAPGTHVTAACSGTVRAVTADDLMGTTVVLSHDGGYETVYANLQAAPTVAEGDYVSAGQVIGAVGNTSLAESALRPHLHFGVTKDGESVDPDAFLRGEDE